MSTPNRPRQSENITGTPTGARFQFGEPPAWLVAAIPGAPEAREAWQAANAKAREAYGTLRAAQQQARDLREAIASADEIAAADRAERDAREPARRASIDAVTAASDFDYLVRSASASDEIRQVCADRALAAHREAVEAWATLSAALDVRADAWRRAGKPGQAVENRLGVTNPAHARTVVDALVTKFDEAATTRAASGEDVASVAVDHAAVHLPGTRTRTR